MPSSRALPIAHYGFPSWNPGFTVINDTSVPYVVLVCQDRSCSRRSTDAPQRAPGRSVVLAIDPNDDVSILVERPGQPSTARCIPVG